MKSSKKTSRFPKIITKNVLIFSLALSFFMLAPRLAVSSWLIRAEKFHVSVHGQNSCQECHENVDEDSHPNPDDVNKKPEDFFHVDDCFSCHDNISSDLDQGIHGARKIKDTEAYANCLKCHDPHYQGPIQEETGLFDPSMPRYEQCAACHNPQLELPPWSAEDEACMNCHGYLDPEDVGAAERMRELCFHCHADQGTAAQRLTGKKVPLINPDEYDSTSHAGVTCTICHPQAAGGKHAMQMPGNCGQCHLPHDEKVAHDLHALVSCEACHLRDIQPLRDSQSKRILWESDAKLSQIFGIHDMVSTYDDAACRRCHSGGNQIGAAAMVLPAKSILCMPCHAATFSVWDTTTVLALVVFIVGMVLMLSYVFSGSVAGGTAGSLWPNMFKSLDHGVRTVFSSKVLRIIKALFLDVLLQRRLYRQSAGRWFIHSLIFYPFVLRFTWGFLGLLGSLWKPQWPLFWPMLDKNYPLTAFVFDLTGIMIMFGILLAYIRGKVRGAPGQPKQDRIALALIAGIVVIGYALEAMRIAMTGYPDGSGYAFVGYACSRLFTSTASLTGAYGYVWYVHAILTGAMVAYMPFSRLLHIIIAPLVLSMNEAFAHGHKDEA
jgi:hypothetical protein